MDIVFPFKYQDIALNVFLCYFISERKTWVMSYNRLANFIIFNGAQEFFEVLGF